MAKFLNTTGITYQLEELVKGTHERLILISPYLRFNDRMRELLEDRDRFKIDIRIVYGKNELQPDENNWLKSLAFVRASFCKNLHAKCYLNESRAIITSMNLYEFSQVNNNEMGVLIERDTDGPLYKETHDEAQRLIRISEELKVTVEKVTRDEPAIVLEEPEAPYVSTGQKVSASQLAKSRKVKLRDLLTQFEQRGWIVRDGESWKLTPEGIAQGGEMKRSQWGDYIAWPEGVGG